MKSKATKVSLKTLFFSRTWEFLNVYLVRQAGEARIRKNPTEIHSPFSRITSLVNLENQSEPSSFPIAPKNVSTVFANTCYKVEFSLQA